MSFNKHNLVEATLPPFMTSPIGDLTVDSNGLRKAIDEITRCHNKIAQLDNHLNILANRMEKIIKIVEGDD